MEPSLLLLPQSASSLNLTTGGGGYVPIGDGSRLNLTTMQFRAIQYLDEHRGEVVSRKDLYAQLLGRDANPNSRTIDVMISVLRKKLGGMNNGNCQIRSMRGSGYIFSGIAG